MDQAPDLRPLWWSLPGGGISCPSAELSSRGAVVAERSPWEKSMCNFFVWDEI